MTTRSARKFPWGRERPQTPTSRRSVKYEVAIAGAGPAGCAAALAFAQRGARVLLLEANPKASARLAGEWIHPPAVDILRGLGVDLRPSAPFSGGRGFVVLPDDGSRPIVLPYTSGSFGQSFEHAAFVETLRAHCDGNGAIDYIPYARAVEIGDHRVVYQVEAGRTHEVSVDLVVGAAGRTSIAHAALGVDRTARTYSRMAGLVLHDATLPFEGYGHVCLGALGPVLAYRIDATRVRLLMDVPLALRARRDMELVLLEAYAPAIPESLRPALRRALAAGEVQWATNKIRPRIEFGREGLALVGDAVGHHHPLTAVGMTMSFQDAVALADAKSFASYKRERIWKSRVPELLAVALYEVFADTSDETTEIRRAIYDLWRADADERARTMRYLGCQETNPLAFGSSFYKAVFRAGKRLVRHGADTGDWQHVGDVARDLAHRSRWLLRGALLLGAATPSSNRGVQQGEAEDRYGAALRASTSRADVAALPRADKGEAEPITARALDRGVRALVALQAADGSWEGEVVWSAMLAAQMVLASHVMQTELDATRRRRILLHFSRVRHASGTWGLSEWSEPSLFVTTLVYVAARVLGVAASDPLLARAGAFIRDEGGAARVPSWGKFWLAMLNLYGWEGVNPVAPEIWSLPRALPIHPSRYYCHTRLIYLGMATLYGARVTAPRTALTDALRLELYPNGFEGVDFAAARTDLRDADLYAPHSAPLRASYRLLTLLEGVSARSSRREKALAAMRERIRWELRTTNHTSISPVSGLLNILALHAADPRDVDAKTAWARMDGWCWEDDEDGTRVTGARSSTWDTSFAAQALAVAAPLVAARDRQDDGACDRARRRADAFLATQQIATSNAEAPAFDRVDPIGGYCFAGVWHGWPVSDCTAEATLARLASPQAPPPRESVERAVRFILGSQSADGGFGSYEPRRVPFSLEWLNPAEMFGDSMTESSYVECTASCVTALARSRSMLADGAIVDEPVARGVA
ncbi:MAG TPA: FAD-dependent monooxygenase, partial [Byssovorax sp.]